MRATPLLILAALLLPGCAAPERAEADDALDDAVAWLLDQRDGDGRWAPAFVPHMAEVAWATGRDPAAWPPELPVAQQLALPAEEGALLPQLRALYAAALVGGAPRGEAVRRVEAAYDGEQYGDPRLLNDDAVALAVLAAAGRPAPASHGAALGRNQSVDGGWSWSTGGAGESDMTGLVLAALAGTEPSGLSLVDAAAALHFLDATQTLDGGHALQVGADEGNCDSTVWALRAYAMLGAVGSDAAWAFLLGLQRGDGGFAYLAGGSGNGLCTAEAAVLLGLRDQGKLGNPWS